MEPEDIVIITAADARDKLPHFCVDHIKDILKQTTMEDEVDELTAQALYLGNLCALGDTKKVTEFLQDTDPEELDNILNHRPIQQWYGTCLHMVCNWNTGEKAFEMFDILVEFGAKLYKNDYGNLPWEKKGGLFIAPITDYTLGKRNPDEFSFTTKKLRRWFGYQAIMN